MVVDVRSPNEFVEGHLWEALNYPLENLLTATKDIPKDKYIITVSNWTGRSLEAIQILVEAGWSNAFYMDGGYKGWTQADLPRNIPGQTTS